MISVYDIFRFMLLASYLRRVPHGQTSLVVRDRVIRSNAAYEEVSILQCGYRRHFSC